MEKSSWFFILPRDSARQHLQLVRCVRTGRESNSGSQGLINATRRVSWRECDCAELHYRPPRTPAGATDSFASRKRFHAHRGDGARRLLQLYVFD
jgi:hypothetical protein